MSSQLGHQWLIDLDDERVFALFATAVAACKIDESGVWNLPAELEATGRLARQVQERTAFDESLRGCALNGLSTTLLLLIRYTGDEQMRQDYPSLVQSFYRDRAALPDLLPPTPIGAADITEPVDHSDAAVLHNGRWSSHGLPRCHRKPLPRCRCASTAVSLC